MARSMLPMPFPKEAVRDLLGIARALYRVERAKPAPDPARLARLEDIGQRLKSAFDMGSRYEPDTMAGRAARIRAEEATADLGRARRGDGGAGRAGRRRLPRGAEKA